MSNKFLKRDIINFCTKCMAYFINIVLVMAALAFLGWCIYWLGMAIKS